MEFDLNVERTLGFGFLKEGKTFLNISIKAGKALLGSTLDLTLI